MNNKIAIGVIVLVCFVIMALSFGKVVWKPNQYAFSISGDGYYIMHHMAYHAKYGEGTELSSMNYPHNELIFLTDAQGMISIIASWFSRNIIDISSIMGGINNGLLMYTIPLCAILLWLILRELKVSQLLSITFAVLITFLSPQINRITTGHFGIGYTFLLPLVIYWLVRYLNDRPWRLGPYVVGTALLFFGFNNPYILLISASIIVTVAAVILIEYRKDLQKGIKKVLPLAIVSCLPLFIVLFSIKSFDQVEDRVKAPFGYWVNYSTPEAVFLPQQGEMYENVQPIIAYKKTSPEGRAYIGLTSFILLSILVITWGVRMVKNRAKKWWEWTDSPVLNKLVWASIPILFFSMNFFLYDNLKGIKFIPILQQFRAPGRFAWVFYFIGSLAAVYTLQQIFSYLKLKKKLVAYVVLVFFVSLYVIDDYHYLKFLTRNLPKENRVSDRWLKKYNTVLNAAGINKDTYQAIYMLPARHLWTDKLVYEVNFWSEVHSFAISLSTGIPFFNAWLSRMSVSQTLASAQMVSHPLIDKKIEQVLPDQRPILLIIGGKPELEKGEELLIAHADTVLQKGNYTLLSYQPFNNPQDTFWQNAQQLYTDSTFFKEQPPIYYQSFEEQNSPISFYGKGAKRMGRKSQVISKMEIPKDFDYSSTYEFSIWVYVDHERSGLPFIHVTEIGANDEMVKTTHKWACRAKDIQDGWLRVGQEFQINEKTRYLRFTTNYNHESTVDELLVREVNDTTIIDLPNSPNFLYNNFKINKPQYD